MKTKKILVQLLLVLVVAVGFTACNKDDEMPPVNNAITSMRFVFNDSKSNERLEDSKIDLTKAASVKIKYSVNDEKVIKEVSLLLNGDSTKVSTSDMKALAFNGGTKLTIYEANLYDNTEKVLGKWSKSGTDIFEVTSPEGVAVMDRTYGTIGVEKK